MVSTRACKLHTAQKTAQTAQLCCVQGPRTVGNWTEPNCPRQKPSSIARFSADLVALPASIATVTVYPKQTDVVAFCGNFAIRGLLSSIAVSTRDCNLRNLLFLICSNCLTTNFVWKLGHGSLKLTTFWETSFLTKLSHKFWKFRLHGERESMHVYASIGAVTVPLFTYFHSRLRPPASSLPILGRTVLPRWWPLRPGLSPSLASPSFQNLIPYDQFLPINTVLVSRAGVWSSCV